MPSCYMVLLLIPSLRVRFCLSHYWKRSLCFTSCSLSVPLGAVFCHRTVSSHIHNFLAWSNIEWVAQPVQSMIHYHVYALVATAFEINGAHFSGLLWGICLRFLHRVLSVLVIYSFTWTLCGDVVEFCSSLHINTPNWQGTTTSIQAFSLPLMSALSCWTSGDTITGLTGTWPRGLPIPDYQWQPGFDIQDWPMRN